MIKSSLFLIIISTQIHASDLENMIDRLEQQIYRDEKRSIEDVHQEKSSQHQVIGKSTIKRQLPQTTSLKQANIALNQLDNKIKHLSASVDQLHEKITLDAQTSAMVEINVNIEQDEKVNLHAIELKLDGLKLFAINESTKVWLPSGSIPVYIGPLDPGKHRIDLAARIGINPDKAIQLSGDQFQIINNSFDLAIPPKIFNKNYTLRLLKNKEKWIFTLNESDIAK